MVELKALNTDEDFSLSGSSFMRQQYVLYITHTARGVCGSLSSKNISKLNKIKHSNLIKYFGSFLPKFTQNTRIQRDVFHDIMASDSTAENKTKNIPEEKSPLPSSTTSLQGAVPTSTTQNNSTGNATTTSKPSADSKVFVSVKLEILYIYCFCWAKIAQIAARKLMYSNLTEKHVL